MFERLMLQFTESEDYVDVFLLVLLFTIIATVMVDRLVTFRVGGRSLGGLVAVLLTSLAIAHPFVKYLLQEERMAMAKRWGEERLLERHAHELMLYLALFVGATVGFAIATFLVPEGLFTIQQQVLDAIRGPTAAVTAVSGFMDILQNNLWVLLMTFVLSFAISSGILFILIWNASVLGVLIGMLSRSAAEIPVFTFLYMIHGIPEIGGYVFAGIAGSILSYRIEEAVAGEGGPAENEVLLDVAVMLLIGIVLLVGAATIEVSGAV